MTGSKLNLIIWMVLFVNTSTKAQPQNQEGQNKTYQFNYKNGDTHHSESKDGTGNIAGTFSYIGNDGLRHIMKYNIGPKGHEVIGTHEFPFGRSIQLQMAPPQTTANSQPPLLQRAAPLLEPLGNTAPRRPRTYSMDRNPAPKMQQHPTLYIPSVEELIKSTYQNTDFIYPQITSSASENLSVNETYDTVTS